MTTPTPQPACSPGPWIGLARDGGMRTTIVDRYDNVVCTTSVDAVHQEANAQLIARAPETARLLGELAAKVQELGYFRQANLREIEECGTPAEVEVATSELAMWETEFTPLLTQIEGLGGGA